MQCKSSAPGADDRWVNAGSDENVVLQACSAAVHLHVDAVVHSKVSGTPAQSILGAALVAATENVTARAAANHAPARRAIRTLTSQLSLAVITPPSEKQRSEARKRLSG